MDTATNIAKYIINFCRERNELLTNLKLQKLLYYVQGYTMALFDKEAFNENIEAWTYGPVVKEVYNEFSIYGGLEINNQYDNISVTPELEALIKLVCILKMDVPAWSLVKETHKEEPWKLTKEVYGLGNVIPKEFIKKYFKKNKVDDLNIFEKII